MTLCVCTHPPHDHHAWTGHCTGGCGCSYYQADNGTEPMPGTPIPDQYAGIYGPENRWNA